MKKSTSLVSWLLYVFAFLSGIGGVVVLISAYNARTTLSTALAPLSLFGLNHVADLLQSSLVSVFFTVAIALFILCLVLGFLFLVAGRLISRARSLDDRLFHLEQQVADLQAKIIAPAPTDRE